MVVIGLLRRKGALDIGGGRETMQVCPFNIQVNAEKTYTTTSHNAHCVM